MLNVNVNVKCSVYMSDLKTESYNIYGNWLAEFSRHVSITNLRARNTLHSCLPLGFILELTIFHSRLFNISALKLSDIGSKMPDSCCSVGCSNRRGEKPRFGFCICICICICNPTGNTTMPVENTWEDNFSCHSPDQVVVLVLTRKLCQMIKNSVGWAKGC